MYLSSGRPRRNISIESGGLPWRYRSFPQIKGPIDPDVLPAANSGLVDEAIPGSGVCEKHKVVDILGGVLRWKSTADFPTFGDREAL